MTVADPFPSGLFDRLDNKPDRFFYLQPRFVTHVDDVTIQALTTFYGERLFIGAEILDLMSSWVSHLPIEPSLTRVAGLGMNSVELAKNPRLDDHVVQDLNDDPVLPYVNDSFDFVLIALSIQYLVQPLEVFKEIARILRVGGQVIISTSHRCFPTKAIRAFREQNAKDRIQLIAEYIRRSNGFGVPELLDRSPKEADPLWLICGTRCA
ncbi:MAG TPA: methyltransferase type 11 [Gammaproteobacteria bacterium]|nr:methyltransferase type 11 [Gammaproteobacteria bacterium]|tara:strand:+ start:197 stop:823 length:627 start_codon:yes stop_codon:yes gene_type:complete